MRKKCRVCERKCGFFTGFVCADFHLSLCATLRLSRRCRTKGIESLDSSIFKICHQWGSSSTRFGFAVPQVESFVILNQCVFCGIFPNWSPVASKFNCTRVAVENERKRRNKFGFALTFFYFRRGVWSTFVSTHLSKIHPTEMSHSWENWGTTNWKSTRRGWNTPDAENVYSRDKRQGK